MRCNASRGSRCAVADGLRAGGPSDERAWDRCQDNPDAACVRNEITAAETFCGGQIDACGSIAFRESGATVGKTWRVRPICSLDTAHAASPPTECPKTCQVSESTASIAGVAVISHVLNMSAEVLSARKGVVLRITASTFEFSEPSARKQVIASRANQPASVASFRPWARLKQLWQPDFMNTMTNGPSFRKPTASAALIAALGSVARRKDGTGGLRRSRMAAITDRLPAQSGASARSRRLGSATFRDEFGSDRLRHECAGLALVITGR